MKFSSPLGYIHFSNVLQLILALNFWNFAMVKQKNNKQRKKWKAIHSRTLYKSILPQKWVCQKLTLNWGRSPELEETDGAGNFSNDIFHKTFRINSQSRMQVKTPEKRSQTPVSLATTIQQSKFLTSWLIISSSYISQRHIHEHMTSRAIRTWPFVQEDCVTKPVQ